MNRGGSGWIGGVNYLMNLLQGVAALPDRQIETVLFVPPDLDREFAKEFKADEVIHSRLVLPRNSLRMAGMAAQRVLSRNYTTEWLLRRHGIEVLSHAQPLGARSVVKVLSWIPDFQYLHLPEMFSAKERAVREIGNRKIAAEASGIILSSYNAQGDFDRLHPAALGRSEVLQFVSGLGETTAPTGLAVLRKKYGISGPFFHLPNQLWKHKNHKIVIEALALLKRDGLSPLVISTGATEDFRHPGFADELRRLADDRGVANFRILGLVPYSDVTALMRHAAAVINPSLFEGWSTTVEEAKALGKRILLSDIEVHREQTPERGIFFAPHDGYALGEAMRHVLDTYSSDEEARHMARAAKALPDRLRSFAETYQSIILNLAGKR